MKVEPLLIENICLNDPNETKNNNKRKHFNDFTYRNIDSTPHLNQKWDIAPERMIRDHFRKAADTLMNFII